MDHNLEASLAMEGIENMDFEHSGVEVAQETMGLEASVQTDANSMDMDSIEEQPVLMDGGSEEVIISDFIGDQFGFQEYCVQTENTSGANITIDANQLGELNVQNQQNVDMQPYSIQTKPSTSQPGLITIKAIPQQRAGSKRPATIAPYPRQVAIAPKPTKGAPNVQYAIAPKPVYVMNKNNPTSKPVAVQSFKGNTVLAQIGKQLVMVPASHAGQKLKVASIIPGAASDGNNIQLVRSTAIDSAQLIANKAGKQMKTKFIIQGQSSTDPSNQPAVITKLMPVTSAVPTQARYIMQQKTVPISIGGNKVLITSPSKQTAAKGALKKQIISIKAENPKVATSQANMQTKKILITANPAPSQIKTAAAKTATQAQGQRTQLHPINVPGKGIQYIKLVTNQSAVAPKPALKPQTLSVAGKNFVLTDSKGNLIQMNADKVLSGTQPPPLIVSTNAPSGGKVAVNTRKLVRIAPITTKSDTSVTFPSQRVFNSKESKGRVSQSLLVPRETTTLSSTSVSLEQYNEMVEQNNMNMMVCNEDVHEETVLEEQAEEMEEEEVQDDVDVKPTLASLISDAVAGEEAHDMPHVQEVEIEFENTPSKREYYPEDENTNSMDEESRTQRDENLLLVPTNSSSHNREDEHSYQEDTDTSMAENSRVQAEVDIVPYPTSPEIDQTMTDSMIHFEGLSRTMRPRKACNCTKSQCLKLYCDCFANGEFCNQCNCNNCYNNLEHEDTRQKAIRACLERNPNAFRPKIGKAKVGGPEIVRRHNKGCNCKRSGCLKNYCECYEAKIACTLMCKCVGCRNIEETLERRRDAIRIRDKLADPAYRPPLPLGQVKQPCNFMTREVIEAVAQCMLASVAEQAGEQDPVEDILLEMSRCMADIITASHHAL